MRFVFLFFRLYSLSLAGMIISAMNQDLGFFWK